MIVLAIAVVTLGLWIAYLVHLVMHDGYGHRPPPRSHHTDPVEHRFGP